MSTESQEPTFEEWKEAVIAEYGQSLSMSREQALAYLAKRPYPVWIRFAALIVAFVVVLAFTQSPRYFNAAVPYMRLRSSVSSLI